MKAWPYMSAAARYDVFSMALAAALITHCSSFRGPAYQADGTMNRSAPAAASDRKISGNLSSKHVANPAVNSPISMRVRGISPGLT
jgi:hypothetical protein